RFAVGNRVVFREKDFDFARLVRRDDGDADAATDVAEVVLLRDLQFVRAGLERDSDVFPHFDVLVAKPRLATDAVGGHILTIDRQPQFRAARAEDADGRLRQRQRVAVLQVEEGRGTGGETVWSP